MIDIGPNLTHILEGAGSLIFILAWMYFYYRNVD